MGTTTGKNKAGDLRVKLHRGDAKTLLAFDMDKASTKNLAGFTIECKPGPNPSFFLSNRLRFETPARHAQDATQPATSTVNAPLHKFRWVHVPGSLHQGTNPYFGNYTYTVTPRYYDGNGSMLPLDAARSAVVKIEVAPFKSGKLRLGFTRGFVQSQAFVAHFGPKGTFRPPGDELLFDTSQVAGTNAQGQSYTFAQEYDWLGFTARDAIFEVLDDAAKNNQHVDVFAYDLNEPDLMNRLLAFAKKGRIRMILDNASLHHDAGGSTPEDRFEKEYRKVAKDKQSIKRGKFGRYAHDKIFVVSDQAGKARRVLTGSTNFSVTGLYVNSNHVLVFDDAAVAGKYAELFQAAFAGDVKAAAFRKLPLSTGTFSFNSSTVPKTEVTFSPHTDADAKANLDALADRIGVEGKKTKAVGSVLFAVMETGTGTGPVFPALRALHTDEKIFSYGISDTTSGIALYKPGSKRGVLVTGKPGKSKLPPPFDQVPGIGGGHQIHHKFVVCGFNQADAVVYCGSSNLAQGGEEENGDNLLAIRDGDVATVFAIEALALVDHFHFLDSTATEGTQKKKPTAKPKSASKADEAAAAGWFLSTDDDWVKPYYDDKDLKSVDRKLFVS